MPYLLSFVIKNFFFFTLNFVQKFKNRKMLQFCKEKLVATKLFLIVDVNIMINLLSLNF